MRPNTGKPWRHLTSDEVESLALGLAARPRGAEAHLAACQECRREVGSLRALDAALSGLGHLAPSPGFTARVMARVQLGSPWQQAWRFARERWISLAAASVALVAATGLMALWLTSQPQLSIGGLTELMLLQARDFSLRVVMGIGGLLWGSSLIRSALEAAGRIGMEGAILVLSAISLVTIGAAGALLQLLRPAPLRLRNAA